MKIAIHPSKGSFSDRWISYCENNGIEWKQVNCYSNDIIEQLDDCDALMWHINQNNPKDNLFAKQLVFSVTTAGKQVFPDVNTIWHFDDKLGQKYLLEAIDAPLPKTWVFYDREKALQWAEQAKYPIVFKLRCGGGSQNVRLIKNVLLARRMIRRAFRYGFAGYFALSDLKERWRQFSLGMTDIKVVIKGLLRFFMAPPYARKRIREKGYIYFQEYIPGNTHDIRIIVVGKKAFAIKRMVRSNDFRASGSGMILYEKECFEDSTVELAFEMAEKLKTQSAAFDFVYSEGKIYVLEVSFGFIKEVYDPCTGFWDRGLNWHEGKFDPNAWMVEDLIKRIKHTD